MPGTSKAFQPAKAVGFPDNRNVFLAKFSPAGALLWSTFLGGNNNDQPTALGIDSAGAIYVTGTTGSSNFPTTPGAYQTTSRGGLTSYLSKVSAEGSALLYSTYLSGLNSTALTVDGSGQAYIAGSNGVPATSFVTPGALAIGATNLASQTGGIFLMHMNATGTGLLYGAYLGGSLGLNGSTTTSLAIDSQGRVYVAGYTAVANIPTTSNALQGQYSNPGFSGPCCNNGFVVEVNPSGTAILYGTYFGPQYSATTIEALTVQSDGSLYIAGLTNSTTIQATAGAYLMTPAAGLCCASHSGRAINGVVLVHRLGRWNHLPRSYGKSNPERIRRL